MNEKEMGASDFYLAPQTEVFDQAAEIAQTTVADTKYPFVLEYDLNDKEYLLSVLNAVGAVVTEEDDSANSMTVSMNMSQLRLIKSLDCITRVKTDEGKSMRSAAFAARQTNNESVAAATAEAQVMTLANDEVMAANEVSVASADDGIAVACISGCTTGNNTKETALEISVESTVNGCICCPGAEQWFKFTAPESKKYTIFTMGALDTVGTLYDCDGVELEYNDNNNGKESFRIKYVLNAGESYYVKVEGGKSNTGSYKLRVTQKSLVDSVTITPATIILEMGKTYELPICPNHTYLNLPGTEYIDELKISLNPASADEQRVMWYNFDSGVVRIVTEWKNGEVYQTLIPTGMGTTKLCAYDWDEHGMYGECEVTVNSMLVYRTRNRERLGFLDSSDNNDITPITAEDLTYGNKSKNDITSSNIGIGGDDFNGPYYDSFEKRVNTVKNFFNSQINDDDEEEEKVFEEILSNMVDHFVAGSGTDYSNPALTSAVQSHEKTQNYVNGVIALMKSYISKNKGNVEKLFYEEELWIQPAKRALHPLIQAMNLEISNGNKNLYLPSYGWDNGVSGLTLAIDGFYGNKIRLESFQTSEDEYSGIVEFTFYDHFGLDTSDLKVERFGNLIAGVLPGFRQWYILQHWNELEGNVQPKPFVTNVSFAVSFGGAYE